MRAWVVKAPGELSLVELPVPSPAPDELLLRVLASGVCRTDLHVLDGDLPPHKSPVVPGHQVVGSLVATGANVPSSYVPGVRYGVPWLRRTCGACSFCLRGKENLCPSSVYTGWDVDGGYAEYVTVPAAYAYQLPSGYPDAELAPFLCAGIIGYRALRRSELPPGGRLGIYGFGASAHLTAQVALARGAEVNVLTRSAAARALARDLGASWVGDSTDRPPEPLDAAIIFAPAGSLVPVALEALGRGGTLSIAGIYLTEIPPLDYDRQLFQERDVRSVTANTRQDGNEFMSLAAIHPLRVAVSPYPFARADLALADLRAGRIRGVGVLTMP